ncbi:hypothetical protein B0H13DRAFT_2407589, partial [Mycena leptocephala]
MTFFFYICHPILVSKAFCEVFRTHPKLSEGRLLAGPGALDLSVVHHPRGSIQYCRPRASAALHVLRYLYYNEDGSVTDTDDPHHDGCGLPGRTSCDCYHGRIETKIAGELKIVENLGRIWGISTVWRASFVSNTHVLTVCSPIRHKDRTSGTSVLTGVVVLPARDVPDHAVLQPALWGSLYAIVRFLRFILDPVCTWTENRERCGHPTVDGTAWRTACLGVPRIRPDARFGLYENDEENLLYAGYFSLPFENIWTMRKMKAVKDEGPRRGGFSITLSARMTPLRNPLSVKFTIIRGSQCPTAGGVALITASNWDRLPTWPSQFLKNRLKFNPPMQNADARALWASVFSMHASTGGEAGEGFVGFPAFSEQVHGGTYGSGISRSGVR